MVSSQTNCTRAQYGGQRRWQNTPKPPYTRVHWSSNGTRQVQTVYIERHTRWSITPSWFPEKLWAWKTSVIYTETWWFVTEHSLKVCVGGWRVSLLLLDHDSQMTLILTVSNHRRMIQDWTGPPPNMTNVSWLSQWGQLLLTVLLIKEIPNSHFHRCRDDKRLR